VRVAHPRSRGEACKAGTLTAPGDGAPESLPRTAAPLCRDGTEHANGLAILPK
jgi:hypothetical protein